MAAFRSFAFLPLAAALFAAGPPRVFLFSLDGLGHKLWTEDPLAAELTALKRIAARGVTAKGVVPHFPSTTANSHAAIFTGAYGNVNGIAANSTPRTPRAEHTFTERFIGFRSDGLKAEPIWAAAARQGVKAVAYQVTQAYPFIPLNTAAGARVPPVVVNGYQTPMVAPALGLTEKNTEAEDCRPWRIRAVRCVAWTAGPHRVHAAVLRDGMWISFQPGSRERVEVKAAPLETSAPRARPLARHFSRALFATPELAVHFRLFSLASDASRFFLLQTPMHELGYYTGTAEQAADLRAMLRATGAFMGNGPSRVDLGRRVDEGGDGAAERRYLEAMEFVVRQNVRQTEWLFRRYAPRLLAGYSNYPDELDHSFLGLTSAPTVSEQVRRQSLEFRRWGYVIVNYAIDRYARLARPQDHVIFTSDHGMTPVWKRVNVARLLDEAGFRDRAAHVYNFLVLNTTDWKNGVIPLRERAGVLDRIESMLRNVKDPDTGAAVFCEFARPERDGERYGIGGEAGGDLYWDLAPGYYFTSDAKAPLIETMRRPSGNHGYLPTREDMLAIGIAAGPRLPLRVEWPRLRGIDIAPLACDLLGIEPPRHAVGRSPLR